MGGATLSAFTTLEQMMPGASRTPGRMAISIAPSPLLSKASLWTPRS